MIRAMLMFSVVLVSVLNAGCQKEKRPTPTTIQRPMLRPPLPGAVPPANLGAGTNTSGDPSLNANGNKQAAVQTQVPSTVRAQKADLGDGTSTSTSDASQGVSAAPAGSSNDYNYNADGTATLKYAAPAAAQAPATAAAAPTGAADPNAGAAPQAAEPKVAAPDVGTPEPAASTSTTTPDQQTADPAAQPAAAEQTTSVAPAGNGVVVSGQFEPVSPTLYSVKEASDPNWAPGLGHDKAPEAIPTNGVRADGAVYTDGKYDAIMASLWNGFGGDSNLLEANKALAPTITDVSMVSYDGVSYTLAINVNENGNTAQLVFQGKRDLSKLDLAAKKFKSFKPKDKEALAKILAEARTFDLELQPQSQSAAPLLYRYHAKILCSDKKVRTCENAVIEMGRFDKNAGQDAKPIAMAYMVHRLGPAVVTVASSDPTKENDSHQKFKAFLSASAKKACLSEKQNAKDKQKADLEKVCANDEGTASGAEQILMRTWAIAGGGAKFQVIFADSKDKKDVYFTKALMISGEMILVSDKIKSAATVIDRANLGRDSWFKDYTVKVMNSDGAGALNFEMTFEGEGGSTETERMSVISNFSPSKAPHLAKKKQSNQTGV